MTNLTKKQATALDFAHGDWARLADFARVLDTTPEGAAATLGSLVRRGLVVKQKAHGTTWYRAVKRGTA